MYALMIAEYALELNMKTINKYHNLYQKFIYMNMYCDSREILKKSSKMTPNINIKHILNLSMVLEIYKCLLTNHA